MLDDLKYYFALVSFYRSATSNIIQKNIIVDTRLPDLASKTNCQRLKLQIGKFLKEIADVSTKRSQG